MDTSHNRPLRDSSLSVLTAQCLTPPRIVHDRTICLLQTRTMARELTKLGHEVGLTPAKDVKAYVKRDKNDAADAKAICEAVWRPVRCENISRGYWVGTASGLKRVAKRDDRRRLSKVSNRICGSSSRNALSTVGSSAASSAGVSAHCGEGLGGARDCLHSWSYEARREIISLRRSFS
jgi:hypothetical protein